MKDVKDTLKDVLKYTLKDTLNGYIKRDLKRYIIPVARDPNVLANDT